MSNSCLQYAKTQPSVSRCNLLFRKRPRVAIVMISRRLLVASAVIKLCLRDAAAEHVIGVFFAEAVRERHFRQLTARVPFILAATVGKQAPVGIILVVVFLITNEVLTVNKLIARVISILRPNNRISFADFADSFEKFGMLTWRQVYFTIDNVIDGSK